MDSPSENAMRLQKQLYGVAIFEEEIVLSDFTSEIERRFVITPEQLMGFIRTEVTFRAFPGLIWMKSGGEGERYLLVLPPGERTILYRRKKKVTTRRLHLPSIAAEASMHPAEKKISSIHLWGFAGRDLKPDSVLYELPLPNLHNSSLCLGSTERAADSDIRGAVERTIFDTPFNHHNHLVGRESLPFHDYVKKYKGRCPLHTLKRIGRGRDILEGRR